LENVESKAIKLLRPKLREKRIVKRVLNLVKKALEKKLGEKGIEAVVEVQGSYAKDTWISGDLDLDVFILLPHEFAGDKLKTLILPVLEDVARENRWKYYRTQDRSSA